MKEMILKMEVMRIDYEGFCYGELPVAKVTGYINEKLPTMPYPGIKKVIFNNPATIILWNDGTRTVVKCNGRDTYDPEKGFAMAISKKVLGSYPAIKRIIRKYSPDDEITLKQFSKESGLKIGYSVENKTE